MPGGGGPADDPAGKGGEHIDGGLVRESAGGMVIGEYRMQ